MPAFLTDSISSMSHGDGPSLLPHCPPAHRAPLGVPAHLYLPFQIWSLPQACPAWSWNSQFSTDSVLSLLGAHLTTSKGAQKWKAWVALLTLNSWPILGGLFPLLVGRSPRGSAPPPTPGLSLLQPLTGGAHTETQGGRGAHLLASGPTALFHGTEQVGGVSLSTWLHPKDDTAGVLQSHT